jgi:hypothetical protein
MMAEWSPETPVDVQIAACPRAEDVGVTTDAVADETPVQAQWRTTRDVQIVAQQTAPARQDKAKDLQESLAQTTQGVPKALTKEELNAIREQVKATQPKLYDHKPSKKKKKWKGNKPTGKPPP